MVSRFRAPVLHNLAKELKILISIQHQANTLQLVSIEIYET